MQSYDMNAMLLRNFL